MQMKKSMFGLAFVSCVFLGVSPAAAGNLYATFDSDAGQNFYSVQFPAELGGEQINMEISGGHIDLAMNFSEGTVQVESWLQEIEPILIYGASTGPITVTLDDSKPTSGSYNPLNGDIEISMSFILEFDDSRLQNFGFTSPFYMTAVERGTIVTSGDRGAVYLFVDGAGEFQGGEFGYTCQTTAEFEVPTELGQPGDVTKDRKLDLSDPVSALGYLFSGEEANCPDAIEVNGDGDPDLSDVIYTLSGLFLGGKLPPVSLISCEQ